MKKKSEEVIKDRNCQHYWVIGPQDGETSTGVCKKCGSVREFYNHMFVPPVGMRQKGKGWRKHD